MAHTKKIGEAILKKKLLFVVEAMGGGVFSYIVDLSNKLIDEYDIYVAYGVRNQTPRNYKDYFDSRVKLIEVKNFKRSVSIVKDLKAFGEIIKIKKKVNPDIIHLHSSKAGVLGRLAFAFDKQPVFYTPHGFSFLMSDISSRKRKVYKLIEKLCSLGGATTIACSPGEFKESLKLTKRTKLVNNGINVSKIQPLENVVEDELEIVTVGRATYQKNPRLFNDIAKMLPNLKFTWIGDGELAKVLDSPNVTVTGWLTRKEAMRKLQRGKIFILTSLWEGLPISLLEAMYLGKVCIVTDVVGNRDVIKDGINGFVCQTSDDFVHVINNITSGKIDMSKLVAHAQHEIVKRYNTDVMAEEYSHIYRNSLRNKGE